MNAIRPMPYVVTRAPTSPGPASSIVYDIDLNTPTGPLAVTNVKPHSDRPPDEIDTQPVKVNTAGWAFAVGSEVQILMNEREAYGPCNNGIATDPGETLIRTVMGMTTDQRNTLRVLLGGSK